MSGQAQRSYNMGLSSAYVHETDLALSFLEKAAAAKESAILNIKNEPMLDEIRRDPRFIALEKRVGLQP